LFTGRAIGGRLLRGVANEGAQAAAECWAFDRHLFKLLQELAAPAAA
jgi:hypothetical protein